MNRSDIEGYFSHREGMYVVVGDVVYDEMIVGRTSFIDDLE